MADTKITGLTALTGANLATGDVFVLTDVSDATMDASGTNKKMTADELAIGMRGTARFTRCASDTHTDSSAVNTTAQTVVASQAVPTTVAAGDVLRLIAVGDLLNNTGGAVNYTLATILGATTPLTTTTLALVTNALRHAWRVEIELLVVAAASDERLAWLVEIGAATSSTGSFAIPTASTGGMAEGYGTAAEDLTAGKNLQLAVTMGTANASADFVCHASWLEVVKR